MRKAVKRFTILADTILIAITAMIAYYFIELPDDFYVSKGNRLSLSCFFDVNATDANAVVQSSGSKVIPLDSEETVTLKLFGIIPIKEVNVKTVDRPVLVPGGTPFGIKMLTEGVMVIAMGEVPSQNGLCSPATDAGIRLGDMIVSVDGQDVGSNSDIRNIIQNCDGKAVKVMLRRNGTNMQITLHPVYSTDENAYKAGMFVRDSTAGIGTITFYDPETGSFGGLGHPVCDVNTGEIMPISSGEVVDVSINGVNKGIPGEPGELLGNFVSMLSVGTLRVNNNAGLFGELDKAPGTGAAIPMAMRQEVKVGDATILSTVEGSTPKEYKVKIEKIDLNESGKSKNMVVRITDPELLEITGGIVQGMSGSPIIQNGMLVGAVTHVFVNDPTKGYGIFCDTMYEYASDTAQDPAA